MDPKGKYKSRISSYFTPENIDIYNEPVELDTLVYKLLENLALNYGIGNIKNLYEQQYLTVYKKIPIEVCDTCQLFHFRITSTDDPRIAISVVKNGIVNNNESKTKIILVTTSPKHTPDVYLKIRKAFKFLLCDQRNSETIFKAKNGQEIWDLIDRTNLTFPDVILAEDVMQKVLVKLEETQTLKDAIDLIVTSGIMSIPVVDLEGNLVGEVTSKELMEVCLPRYILWVNDITPIVNFEPFQNMLEHEDSTWLAEIMHYGCATIQEDEPFMKAAVAMTKKSVKHVYVLNNRNLRGVITLHFFLKKILRE